MSYIDNFHIKYFLKQTKKYRLLIRPSEVTLLEKQIRGLCWQSIQNIQEVLNRFLTKSSQNNTMGIYFPNQITYSKYPPQTYTMLPN